MATKDVLMPSMGEGITEAVLVRWLKKPGEKVSEGEPLFEVSTDKVDTEIPAPATGYVSLIAKEGASVAVNNIIARISPDASGASTAPVKDAPKASPAASSPTPKQNGAAKSGGSAAPAQEFGTATLKRSSPLVRKIAKDNRVNLDQLTGSGMHGRITKKDIVDYMESGSNKAAPAASTSQIQNVKPTHDYEMEDNRLVTTTQNGVEYLEGVPVVREKMTHMRKMIAEHMIQSVRTSPHVTTVFEIDMHHVVNIREKYKDEFERKEGFKLTYTPFIIHAATKAIKEHPIINTSLDGDEILFKKDINIGCAVAIKEGLIVPVIKNAGDLNLAGICRKLNDLATRARSKKLLPDEVRGGTFSITNPGGFGSLTSNPIISQPQVAILGIGTITKRPVVIDDMIGIRPLMMVSLTFDHRVVDGEGGARYLATLKKILESYNEIPL
jgi:2-oxoglutarate dehydrogenase complex dihydrolipoamide succinyltransferase (E2) component